MSRKPRVAFVCVHNACRSQMAEAIARILAGDVFDSFSAGTETKPAIDPTAVRLVREQYGVDMTETQYSKTLDALPEVDVVVTMGCNVQCPSLPCRCREDWGLDDPTGKEDSVYLAVMDTIRQRVLEQILYHLGRWVYLVDAADDLKKDAASGNYNPVALRFGLTDGIWTAEARREFAATLDHYIHMMATAFELWDFGVWTPILETTFYTGLFHVGKAVLDGTFRTARRGEDRKKSKNVEEST